MARESYASIAESYVSTAESHVSMTERYVGMTERYVCKSDVRQTLYPVVAYGTHIGSTAGCRNVISCCVL